jgi:hypothetical protein
MKDTMDSNIIGIDPAIHASMKTAAALGVDFYHFLDSFSQSQIESKSWLVDTLSMADINDAHIQLFGGWNGILITRLLVQNLNLKRIHNIDLDEKSIRVFMRYREFTNDKRLESTCGDVMTPHKYDPNIDIVINTSSEHMLDLKEIIKDKKYKPECLFALQSNNMFHIIDHINCVSSEDELVKKSGLSKIMYKGSLDMPNGYKRFMVIGYV